MTEDRGPKTENRRRAVRIGAFITSGEAEIGFQQISELIHAPGVAFRVTAYTESPSYVESQLRLLLALTDLKAIQWINLNHSKIEFTTIKKLAGE